jgi:hypothetical protein
VRYDVRRLFERVLEAVEDDLALPPERRRLAPKPLWEQQEGRPCAQVTAQQCQQGRQAAAFLLRQALWRAVDALEAAALQPACAAYQSILVEQCTQFAWVYAVLQQHAPRPVAAWILYGELRLLRHHRGSQTAERMLFGQELPD